MRPLQNPCFMHIFSSSSVSGFNFAMQNETIYQRINYLFQAAYQSLKSSPNDLSICRFYLCTLKVITRRHVLHLHHDMKRVICKRCCVLLVPGVTTTVRNRNKKHKHTVLTCVECGTIRRFHNNRHRKQWLEKDESWEKIMVEGKRQKNFTGQKYKGKTEKLQGNRDQNEGNREQTKGKMQENKEQTDDKPS